MFLGGLKISAFFVLGFFSFVTVPSFADSGAPLWQTLGGKCLQMSEASFILKEILLAVLDRVHLAYTKLELTLSFS